jgi:hypothetical protein
MPATREAVSGVSCTFKGICMASFTDEHWLANDFNTSVSGTTGDSSISKGGSKPME